MLTGLVLLSYGYAYADCDYIMVFSEGLKQNRLHNRLQPCHVEANDYSYREPPLDKVDFDAVLSLWKLMKLRRILL